MEDQELERFEFNAKMPLEERMIHFSNETATSGPKIATDKTRLEPKLSKKMKLMVMKNKAEVVRAPKEDQE